MEQYSKLLTQLKNLLEQRPFLIIGIDGRCASGKTTLSNWIAEKLPARIFHMDDFYLPMEQRVKDWKHIPCANMNFERMLEEVLRPAQRGEVVQYRAYSCREKKLLPAVELEPRPLNIVEGSYSHYPYLFPFYDVSVFLTCSKETQTERLIRREGDRYPNYEKLWIPLEEEYYRKYHVGEQADYRITT